MSLEWAPPRNDGGTPVETYIIEKRPKLGQWTKALEVSGKIPKATVPNLTENEEYEFRIIAKNKAGPSEPSDASKSIVVKPRFLGPHLDRSFLEDLVVRAGQKISFAVPISGSPLPKATWTVDGKKSERADVSSVGSIASLEIPSAVRGDTGRYVLTLENELGTVSGSANVSVVDRPSTPESLSVSDVTKQSCRLSWNPPQDDGGSPIQCVQYSQKNIKRYNYLS